MTNIFDSAPESYLKTVEYKRQLAKMKIDNGVGAGHYYCYIDLSTPQVVLDELVEKGYGITRDGASTYRVFWGKVD